MEELYLTNERYRSDFDKGGEGYEDYNHYSEGYKGYDGDNGAKTHERYYQNIKKDENKNARSQEVIFPIGYNGYNLAGKR